MPSTHVQRKAINRANRCDSQSVPDHEQHVECSAVTAFPLYHDLAYMYLGSNFSCEQFCACTRLLSNRTIAFAVEEHRRIRSTSYRCLGLLWLKHRLSTVLYYRNNRCNSYLFPKNRTAARSSCQPIPLEPFTLQFQDNLAVFFVAWLIASTYAYGKQKRLGWP